jgi:hypothetical protein
MKRKLILKKRDANQAMKEKYRVGRDHQCEILLT